MMVMTPSQALRSVGGLKCARGEIIDKGRQGMPRDGTTGMHGAEQSEKKKKIPDHFESSNRRR